MDNMHIFPHWLQSEDDQSPILEPEEPMEFDEQPPILEQVLVYKLFVKLIRSCIHQLINSRVF